MKNCIVCQVEIENYNKSGYCTKCYHFSPQYRKYQRLYHVELRKTSKHKKKYKEYLSRPEVKKRKQKYQKAWMKAHRERMNELRKIWANKPENREKRRKYQIKWRKKHGKKTT